MVAVSSRGSFFVAEVAAASCSISKGAAAAVFLRGCAQVNFSSYDGLKFSANDSLNPKSTKCARGCSDLARWPWTPRRSLSASAALLGPAGSSLAQRPYTAVLIIPTGVGAAIGGFAGDAIPVARTLASVVDCLITHPNVLNGAMMYWPLPNALYVEGYGLDKFASGEWGLEPVHQNRVGLVLDAGMEEELRARHCQVADAARASLGLPVLKYTVTDAPLQVDKWIDPTTGASTGRLGNPDSLLRAAGALLEDGDVDALAVVARFPDDSLDDIEDYRQGQGVDALAGVEAVISHLVVEKFNVACAHAPALAPIPLDPSVAPRSAAEELGYTFLPCVLAGLARAPRFVTSPAQRAAGQLWADHVDCIILPRDACGGAGALAFARRAGKKPLLLAVEENETVLNDTPGALGLDALSVANYWEAAGVVAAHKAGVDPFSLRRGAVRHIARLPVAAALNGRQPAMSPSGR